MPDRRPDLAQTPKAALPQGWQLPGGTPKGRSHPHRAPQGQKLPRNRQQPGQALPQQQVSRSQPAVGRVPPREPLGRALLNLAPSGRAPTSLMRRHQAPPDLMPSAQVMPQDRQPPGQTPPGQTPLGRELLSRRCPRGCRLLRLMCPLGLGRPVSGWRGICWRNRSA